MLTTLKSTVLALAIGLGAVSGAPAIAQAEGLYFNLGNGQGPSVEVDNGDSYRQYPRRGERRYDRRYDRRQENREYGSRCSVERAVNKAERMGLHRVRVVDVGRHSITVRGRSYGERARLTFGRAPSCPVIG